MANKTSWKTITGNRFARAMWFARLRATGAYDANCKRKKGICKTKTKGSAAVLRAGKFANVGPRDGAKAMAEMRKATEANKKKGLAKGGAESAKARVALVRNVRKLQQEAVKSGKEKVRGAKISVSLKSANVTPKGGKTRQVKVQNAVGVSAKKVSEIKRQASESSRQFALSMRKKERTGKLKSTQQRKLSAKFKAMERGETVATPKRKSKKS
jgi:hypothetical protein